jgi:mannonate dehydratase
MAAALHFGLAVHNFGIQEYMHHTALTKRSLSASLSIRSRLHVSRGCSRSWR